MIKLLGLLILFCTIACNSIHQIVLKSDTQWIDLSYAFDSTTLYWPNNAEPFIHRTDAEGVNSRGWYYSSYTLCTPEHGGTHLDAPSHFSEGKLTVDQLPLSSLTGYAVVIDVTSKTLANRDYRIQVTDISDWEGKNGRIADHSIILFRTGFGDFYPDRIKYFGTAKTGPESIPELHFPGIHQETAQWLVLNRRVKALGLDTPSLDYGQSVDFEAHRALLSYNVPGFENLANLQKLPPKGAYVVALPMKITKGSGGPLRIMATMQNFPMR